MNLFRLLQARAEEGRPVRVGVIGAGKFGSMFLSQAIRTPGIIRWYRRPGPGEGAAGLPQGRLAA